MCVNLKCHTEITETTERIVFRRFFFIDDKLFLAEVLMKMYFQYTSDKYNLYRESKAGRGLSSIKKKFL